jgi:fatty acid desaturase
MDPELKRLIEETRALVKENHDMLRTMRRNAWLGLIFQIVFWIVIIFAPIYFLLPYIGALPPAAELQDLLKVYQTGQL